ncbi:hypothetical protein G9A89_000016 [Geosiphon pyriformis]|nr:hypothetical protein G9A89_000016 [Geosiphon pyriformis]
MILQEEIDFFSTNELPTPVAFFKKFNYKTTKAISKWLDALAKNDDPNFESVPEQKKKSVDKALTKKTAHAESSTSGDIKSTSIQSDDLDESFDEESNKEDLKGSLGNATELEERNDDDDQDEVEDNVSSMDKGAKLEFKKKYMEMRQDTKWKLPSGKYIEDVLYEYAKNLAHESSVHSFIIDTSDATVMNLFSTQDKEHIMSFRVLPDPEIEDELMDYLIKYRKFETQEMRKIVNAGISISPYDPKKHFNHHYIHQVFSQLLPRYELRSSDFTTSHLEGWFTSNIWSIVIDACFVGLEIIEFIRGEGCSRASGERKNFGRNNSNVKKLLGRKCDGIVRELGSSEEYGISEEGRDWTGKDGTKYLADESLKLPKVMLDMLHQKLRKHGINFVRSRQMEIVGFLHSAQQLQILVLDTPSGYMCRIRRYPSSKIPATLTEVDHLIGMIHDVLVAKFRIMRCMGHSKIVNLTSNEALKESLKKKAVKPRVDDDYDLPNTQRTPKKMRSRRS